MDTNAEEPLAAPERPFVTVSRDYDKELRCWHVGAQSREIRSCASVTKRLVVGASDEETEKRLRSGEIIALRLLQGELARALAEVEGELLIRTKTEG